MAQATGRPTSSSTPGTDSTGGMSAGVGADVYDPADDGSGGGMSAPGTDGTGGMSVGDHVFDDMMDDQ